MSNEIKIFENEEFGSVRTMEINGEPYFVGKDVAEIPVMQIQAKHLLTTLMMKINSITKRYRVQDSVVVGLSMKVVYIV